MGKTKTVIQIIKQLIQKISNNSNKIDLSLHSKNNCPLYNISFNYGMDKYSMEILVDGNFSSIRIYYMEDEETWQLIFDFHLSLSDIEFDNDEIYQRSDEEIEMSEVLIELNSLLKDRCKSLSERHNKLLKEMLYIVSDIL